MTGDFAVGMPIEPFEPLSDDERADLLVKIRVARMKLKNGKCNQPFFDAARWVINIATFSAMLDSEFVPGNEFGCRFEDLAKYIERKERETETEEPDDDEWTGSEPVYPPNL